MHNKYEAQKTLDEILNQNIFGNQGNKVVIEEFLKGEASFSAFCYQWKNHSHGKC